MASRAACYLGDHTVLTETTYGRRILVDSRDMSIGAGVIVNGKWAMGESTVVFRYLVSRKIPNGQSELFVDVGANIGWHSLLAYFAQEGKFVVVAVEPNPRLCDLLWRTFFLNNMNRTCPIFRGAASDHHGKMNLWIDPVATGGSFVIENGAPYLVPKHLPPGLSFDSVEVETTTVDELLADDARPIAMLKVDTEGHEPEVIRGADRSLERCSALLIETHPDEAHTEMVRALNLRGFGSSWVHEDGREEPIGPERVVSIEAGHTLLFLKR